MSSSYVLLIFILSITSRSLKYFMSNLEFNMFLVDVIILLSLPTISMSPTYKHTITYPCSVFLTYIHLSHSLILKSCDIMTLSNLSYNCFGACLSPYNDFTNLQTFFSEQKNPPIASCRFLHLNLHYEILFSHPFDGLQGFSMQQLQAPS